MLEIKRTLMPELRDHLQKPEITLLVGPRQAGKTTLLKDLAADLRAEENSTLFYNLDIARDREHFIGQEQFIDQLQAKTGNNRHSVASLHFWRTKAKAKVDFVVNRGYDLLPVEVKSARLKQPTVSRSYRSFLQQYRPAEGWIVNVGLRTDVTVEATTVRFLPWYDLLG